MLPVITPVLIVEANIWFAFNLFVETVERKDPSTALKGPVTETVLFILRESPLKLFIVPDWANKLPKCM